MKVKQTKARDNEKKKRKVRKGEHKNDARNNKNESKGVDK